MCRQVTAAAAKSLQSCPTMCDPTDGSPPGSPVPGILQARTLEWGAIAFSNRRDSQAQMRVGGTGSLGCLCGQVGLELWRRRVL